MLRPKASARILKKALCLCIGAFFAVGLYPAWAQQNSVPAAAAFIPRPQSLEVGTGEFVLSAETKMVLTPGSAETRSAANFLRQTLQKTAGLHLAQIESRENKKGAIHLLLNPAFQGGAEAYALSVSSGQIICRANTGKGLFWAVQSLRQLLELQLASGSKSKAGAVALPALEMRDGPSFAWRGLMLDVSRHFMQIDFLKRYIDLASFYKLNTLHLHLTDDQGWRLQIPAYPKLTQTGAWRQEPDGSTHGGFYTAAEIKELVGYARERHVKLVPEIDVPGHVQAALAAYPELSCTGGPFEVSNKAGVHPDILCAGNEDTYGFLAAVFKEVAALFPGEYVHIGGDEAPKIRWKTCAKCQNRLRAEGLANEEALQGYFTRRVLALLQQYQKKALGWDEVLKGGAGAGMIVQAWHGNAAVEEAVGKNVPVLVSPRSSFYFDLNSGITSVEKVYQIQILPKRLPVASQALVLGAEAALWTETVPQEKVDGMVFPRLLAFAENVWAAESRKEFVDFMPRLASHYAYLDKIGVSYGFETWPVQFQSTFQPLLNAFSVTLKPGLPHVQLHYTLDGSTPSLDSPVYSGVPIQFPSSATLQVVPYKGRQAWHAPLRASFVKHLAIGKQVTLRNPFHPAYAGGGPSALTDGILGDEDYRKGFWQGFEKNSLETEIDLGQEQAVAQVQARFLQDANSWIFLPVQVEFWVAGADRKFSGPYVQRHQVPLLQGAPMVQVFTQQVPAKKVRYVKMKATNVGVCPPGHPGEGGAAFLMADEVIVQ